MFNPLLCSLFSLLLCLQIASGTEGAASNNELFASVGVGSASVRGFTWTYDIENPDLDPPVGKVYWVLTDDGVPMTVDDVMAGSNPTKPDCFGQTVQEDEDIHQVRMDCSLTAGVTYRFWVVVDYDGDGTAAVMTTEGGVPILPQEDKDCDGTWSPCDADCIEVYSITQWPTGEGAGCTIGDEEERTCAPGTDACPLAATFSVDNPTAQGFDMTFDPDDTVNTAGGKWFWMVTPENATPTPAEIQNGDGGLCGGESLITSTAATTLTLDCVVPADTYDVWVAEDPQGDGNPVSIGNKPITIPAATPQAHMYAHTPTLTDYKLSYDIDNPNPNGKFYTTTVPSTAPQPTLQEVMDAANAGNDCTATAGTPVPSPMTTMTVNCQLMQPGNDYTVWGVVDTDALGGQASWANSGTGFTFSAIPATTKEPTLKPTTTTTSEPTVPATSPTTKEPTAATKEPTIATTSAPLPVTTSNPNPNGYGGYRLLVPGAFCEMDDLGGFVQDIIPLPNVAQAGGSNIAKCAGYVAQNRAANGGCSTLFHSGGPSGICACVRIGYVCDEDESEIMQDIFQLCLGPCPPGSVFFNEVGLSKTQQQQGALDSSQPSQHSKSDFPVYWCVGATVLGLIVGFGLYLSCCAPRKIQNEDVYHIALDTQQ